jgi:hypothetical protein
MAASPKSLLHLQTRALQIQRHQGYLQKVLINSAIPVAKDIEDIITRIVINVDKVVPNPATVIFGTYGRYVIGKADFEENQTKEVFKANIKKDLIDLSLESEAIKAKYSQLALSEQNEPKKEIPSRNANLKSGLGWIIGIGLVFVGYKLIKK